jgi:hypothetical protein
VKCSAVRSRDARVQRVATRELAVQHVAP